MTCFMTSFRSLKSSSRPALSSSAAGEGDTNFVVVAVRILALAFVVAQVVACGECVFDGDFVHELSLSPRGANGEDWQDYCTF